MQLHADLFTFTEEILHGKLHFLCSVIFFHRRLLSSTHQLLKQYFMTNCEFGVYYWVQLQETGLEEMKLWYQFLFPKLLKLNFFWNWDFRVHTLLMMLITDVFQLVIYVTFLFWDDTSSFNFAWFCVWFVILRARRGIGVVSHGGKLLIVY